MLTVNPSATLKVNGERSRTIKFFTLGCKTNQYDTQVIREQFLQAGYREVSVGGADIFVINTCTVTQRADSESLRLIRKSKRENPRSKIMVTGCLTELDAEKIKKSCKGACIIKNKDKLRALNFINKTARPNRCGLRGINNFPGHTRAFLKVQEGCDNFCSFCKVPLVRGKPKSRKKEEIVLEAKRLVERGYKEIVITGICLGLYGRDLGKNCNLVNLLKGLEKIDGLRRIRLSSIEPQDVNRALIDLIAGSKKICPHLHIPLQSGDDAILKKMRRRYSSNEYLKLVKDIRKKIPGIAITTDCLVGFPGEEEKNFRNTLDIVGKIMPLKVHVFPYSRREGTSAGNFKQEAGPGIIRSRILQLKKISAQCSCEFMGKFLGKSMEVLVVGQGKAQSKYREGISGNYLRVFFKSKGDLRNQLVNLRLEKLIKEGVAGRLLY